VDIQSGKRIGRAVTKDGLMIKAGQIVLCTGYELPKIVPQGGHRISSTWVIAMKPQPRRLWPEECLIWEAADHYLYVRATKGGRIICGGEDEEFADEDHRDAQLSGKTKTLEKKLEMLLPRVDARAQLAWTA
jgi:glycine/D-amino acid oxidase-like deaminating enzyme